MVRAYIDRFSRPGDMVVDPFGGSGVTAIEAFLMGRRGVQNDLNPFANFIARAVADTRLPSVSLLQQGFARVATRCQEEVARLQHASSATVRAALKRARLPANICLPRNSDAKRFHDLFSPRQLAALAFIREAVLAERDEAVRLPLLLAWSAAAAKLNRTFISAKGRAESRGGSSIFSIYRYKVAKTPVELPLWETFAGRYRNVLAAKREVLALRDLAARTGGDGAGPLDSESRFRVLCEDAVALPANLGPATADYIFTDPPYGAFIAYLDLSTLWNHWLGFRIPAADRRAETIVGGELKLGDEHYRSSLARSVEACLRLLKPDRWFSIVFQHWEVAYFETILGAATGAGAVLRSAVTQERDVIWSMHKKKNAQGMLAGELILTFYKPAAPPPPREVREAAPRLFAQLLDAVLGGETRAEVTSQYLFNRLVLRAWEDRSIGQLTVPREEFARELVRRGWSYDRRRHTWRRGGTSPGELPLGMA